MDNAKYHSQQLNKRPTQATRKADTPPRKIQSLEASALAHRYVMISGPAFSIFDLTFHLKLEISFLDFSECLTVVVYHCVIQITIMALKCRFLVSLKIKMIVKSGLKPYLAQTLNQKRAAK